jgi:hypothetical protein
MAGLDKTLAVRIEKKTRKITSQYSTLLAKIRAIGRSDIPLEACGRPTEKKYGRIANSLVEIFESINVV